ncbi:MAG: glycoside hydrolase family 43 protein [Candidatus Latescibacteria bacterium]|nr:glycoside hydrolase family 43 protein [Candidatus Latescibacterota bacterium]
MVIVPETGKSDGGAESYYLFSYFKGNGEDGLHLAYSRDGLKWDSLNSDKPLITPNVGKDKLMRDPCITFGPDRLFHMVWTTSWTDTVIGYANSPDLVNWSEQLAIPVMGHEPTARNCWAPELFYDSDFEQYLIFWSTTIPGRFDKTAKSSEDNYNHRIYFTITKDFKTFSPTELFYDPGFNVIDATIIKSGSTYIMFFKDERLNPPQKNIRWTSAWRAPGPYDIPSKPITGDYWAEGPTAMMIGDSWYVYFDKYREGEYGAVITKDLKNWDDISSKVSFPEGARHGTVFEVPEKILDGLLEL